MIKGKFVEVPDCGALNYSTIVRGEEVDIYGELRYPAGHSRCGDKAYLIYHEEQKQFAVIHSKFIEPVINIPKIG